MNFPISSLNRPGHPTGATLKIKCRSGLQCRRRRVVYVEGARKSRGARPVPRSSERSKWFRLGRQGRTVAAAAWCSARAACGDRYHGHPQLSPDLIRHKREASLRLCPGPGARLSRVCVPAPAYDPKRRRGAGPAARRVALAAAARGARGAACGETGIMVTRNS